MGNVCKIVCPCAAGRVAVFYMEQYHTNMNEHVDKIIQALNEARPWQIQYKNAVDYVKTIPKMNIVSLISKICIDSALVWSLFQVNIQQEIGRNLESLLFWLRNNIDMLKKFCFKSAAAFNDLQKMMWEDIQQSWNDFNKWGKVYANIKGYDWILNFVDMSDGMLNGIKNLFERIFIIIKTMVCSLKYLICNIIFSGMAHWITREFVKYVIQLHAIFEYFADLFISKVNLLNESDFAKSLLPLIEEYCEKCFPVEKIISI